MKSYRKLVLDLLKLGHKCKGYLPVSIDIPRDYGDENEMAMAANYAFNQLPSGHWFLYVIFNQRRETGPVIVKWRRVNHEQQ